MEGVVEKVKSALAKSNIELSGFSLSTNFNLEDKRVYNEMIEKTIKWMKIASEVGAPVSRIFGGTLKDRINIDKKVKDEAFKRVIDALGVLAKEAEKLGLILAIENHGGLPCTAEEQVYVIEAINSKYLRATIDIGNYMAGGQEAVDGTKIVSKYCAYVHIKDFKRRPNPSLPWGWSIEPCTIGEGDVDVLGCLKVLKDAGYNGYVALEYEGPEDEKTGVPRSLEFIKSVISKL